MMKNILWVTASLNHYKARFLNHLAKCSSIDLTILSGTGRQSMGDQELEGQWDFKHIKVTANKKKFGNSKEVRTLLKRQFSKFDWVLIPAEKKNILLFFYAKYLQLFHKQTKIFSYNHPLLKSGNGKTTFLDKLVTKFYYRYYDRIIFYTEQSHDWAIMNKLIHSKKAFWANNTVDNTEIEKYYSFHLPPEEPQTILFIGRLISSKRIIDLITYYKALKQKHENLNLEIIGDGPDHGIVEKAVKEDTSITWHGTLVDEKYIAPIMMRTSLVFIPGLSGLSINHAFAYGKPYLTLKNDSHGPEISYLKNGANGYILENNLEEDIKKIFQILEDRNLLERLCYSAKAESQLLSVNKWIQQIKLSLLDE